MCVCVEFVFKGPKRFNHSFVFSSLFGVRNKIRVKTDFSCKFYFVSFLLMFFAIVLIINKAFKLFKLVLVVYCDSCCHW